MLSQDIYFKTRLEQARNKGIVIYSGTPNKILLESASKFDAELSMYMPCQILSLSHYIFSSGFSMQTQNVSMFDLIYIYSGSLTVQFPLKECEVSAGEFIMLNTDIRYTIRQNGTEKLDILIIRNYGFICSSFYHLLQGKGFHSIKIRNTDMIIHLLERLIFYFSYPSNANNLLVVDVMNQIYTQLYLNDSDFQLTDNKYCHPDWFLKAVKYMESNYRHKIIINMIAEAADMSESLFYKKFRQYTDTSPTDYLRDIRIRHAEHELLNTDKQIKSIAYETGFRNSSYFVKQFKEVTGISPKQFRDKHNKRT